MKKKHQHFFGLVFLWMIELFLFVFISQEVPVHGFASSKILGMAAFIVLFAVVLVTMTLSAIKHRRDDQHFEHLPPE